jgi:hypothetical protein
VTFPSDPSEPRKDEHPGLILGAERTTDQAGEQSSASSEIADLTACTRVAAAPCPRAVTTKRGLTAMACALSIAAFDDPDAFVPCSGRFVPAATI